MKIYANNAKRLSIMKIIKRKNYLNQIKPYFGKNVIKVLTGQRRVGKSYLLRQIMDIFKKSDQNTNIIYIDKEKLEFDSIRDYRDLYTYITEKSDKNCINIVMIDEVQEIEGFEKVLRDLNENSAYDIFCTGSNANLLSGELSTFLAGRYVQTQVHSLSYREFLKFHQLAGSVDSLGKYIKYGGMPYLIHLDLKNEIVSDYLKSIYNSIILKDVVARHNIRNVNFLDRLVLFLADNTGSILAANNISDFLKSQRVRISVNTVMSYLDFLINAFFINKVSRYDIAGKKIFEINEKYYFEDLGLRNSIIGFKQKDMGKILENLIYIQLKYKGYEVYVGKQSNMEIDFVAKKHDKTIYIQAAYLLKDKKTIDREFGNLLKLKDNFRKIVVSMDDFAQGNVKGVEHLHIMTFLKEFG
ncbi:MAG: ATP-binding protein [Desulfobacteraceae bacterium]|nr:ATP-binding protein [Desulfobacteraceae bacterium]